MSIGLSGGLVPKAPPQVKDAFYDPASGRYMRYAGDRPIAPEWKPGMDIPPGYCVVYISNGDNVEDIRPVEATIDEEQICIPRESNRLVNKQFYSMLKNCVEDRYVQPVFGAPLQHRRTTRFPIHLIEDSGHAGVFIDPEHDTNPIPEVPEINVAAPPEPIEVVSKPKTSRRRKKADPPQEKLPETGA